VLQRVAACCSAMQRIACRACANTWVFRGCHTGSSGSNTTRNTGRWWECIVPVGRQLCLRQLGVGCQACDGCRVRGTPRTVQTPALPTPVVVRGADVARELGRSHTYDALTHTAPKIPDTLTHIFHTHLPYTHLWSCGVLMLRAN